MEAACIYSILLTKSNRTKPNDRVCANELVHYLSRGEFEVVLGLVSISISLSILFRALSNSPSSLIASPLLGLAGC